MREAILIALAALAPAGGEATSRPPSRRYVVVFDLACREKAAYGSQLADSIRTRLRRHKDYTVIDRLTTAELTPAGGVSLKTPDAEIVKLLKERAGAHLAVYGDVQKVGANIRAEVRCVDVSGSKPAAWTRAFSDETERARGLIAREVVEAITRSAEWRPPEYGDEAEPAKFGKPLNRNGGFEAGRAGWARPDNVSTKLVPDPRAGRKGKVLKIFTDLDREKWLEYQRDLRLGKADPKSPPAIGTVADKYATVAALEGVHYRSEWIDAKGGQGKGTPNAKHRVGGTRRYWLVADMKGRTGGIFFPKIFVKGFADFTALADAISEVSLNELKMTAGEFAKLPADKRKQLIKEDAQQHPDRHRREVYRWYLACRNEQGAWKHYAAAFPPRGGLPGNVRWLRIEVYAYWPPGAFLFDEVHMYRDPRQKAPLPEAKARTPHYRQPSTQPAPRAQ